MDYLSVGFLYDQENTLFVHVHLADGSFPFPGQVT